MEEEFDSNEDQQSSSRPSTNCPYNRVGGGHSMTSTNFTSGTALTTTTNEDDGAQLIKPKKKKGGLFKNLFHFGSRKGRSKSASSEPSEAKGGSPSGRHSHNESNNSEEVFRSPDLMRNRQYLIEQERINAQYRKLMEAKQRQQQQNHHQHQQSLSQPPQFVRNQLHPMHQSMPIGQRSRSSPSKQQQMLEQPLIGSPTANGYAANFVSNYGSHPRQNKISPQTAQQFGSLNIHKKNESNNISKMNAYMMSRQHHRVHPEMNKFSGEVASHTFGGGDANVQVRMMKFC